MKMDEMLLFLRAGYTKSEIESFENASQSPTPSGGPESPNVSEPMQLANSSTAPRAMGDGNTGKTEITGATAPSGGNTGSAEKKENATSNFEEMLKAVMNEITDMKKTMQRMNINTRTVDTLPPDTEEQLAFDFANSVINPSVNGKGEGK